MRGAVELQLAQQLPEGYAGYALQSRGQPETSMLTQKFTKVMQDYSVRSVMKLNYTACGEECLVTVKVGCSST